MIKLNLNGWQRLWLFFSVIWIIAVTTLGYIDHPLRDGWYTAPPVALMSNETLELLNKGTKEGGVSFQVPGYLDTIFLPKSTPYEIQFKVAKELYELSTAEYTKTVSKYWKITALIAIVPCMLVFLLGLGIVWVRVGFRK